MTGSTRTDTGYATVTVVIGGALAEELDVQERDWDAYLNAALSEWDAQSQADAEEIEMYVLWHEHAPDIECECAQYAQDHHPAYTWNVTPVTHPDTYLVTLPGVQRAEAN